MDAVERWMRKVAMIAVALAVVACATGGAHGVSVPIRDLQSIAGRWQGLMQAADSQQDDFIDVTLVADGTYQTGGARTVGVIDGRGRAAVQDGRLRLTGERSTATGRLFEKEGKRTLVIDVTAASGRQFTARLSPRP